MPTNPQVLLWTPPNTEDVELLPVGKWWDAISAPTAVADRALELLGDRSGAVIQDDTYGKAYWLIGIDTSTASSWRMRGVRILTELADEGTLLGLPPAAWGPEHQTYWRIPLGPNRYLTDTHHLVLALRQALDEVFGPEPDGRQLCYHCHLPTDEPIPVEAEDSRNAVGKVTYACPPHAPLYKARRPRTLASAAAAEHEGRRHR
ncbi:hypothetical protein [Streptomyces rapamycinicus]|uniref:Uncharacterized protein n=2 Tax=Streptomyces rapamycinicus TaxID=1226757 RepID=A0A3L8R4K6_STRRN|nr:hypothetical protein [Streptomyces rapamycinicus]MBB4781273.1 hypothetical protein [Streptomyces rapamycinicus]RLV74083.1 hypothetical protein D3C57_132695 [Streptomyces rapamycinicus NRRL 5491]UTO61906.1 hypothetical protein LJB45_05960 [Streptomyces rapamycinicus]UTP29858.1 hypothetical protein LIV37_11075 [Streptomyces rapamycinicus NRRL 5491]